MNSCIGCGAELQTKDKTLEGYVKEENLDKKLCERCFRIRNYGDYKRVSKTNVDFKKILDDINNTNDLVVLVVDLFMVNKDFEEITKNINNDILLVLTKRDILPKVVNDQKFLDYAKTLNINYID